MTKITKSNAEWRELLTADQYYILRESGTERAGSSFLNEETRNGVYSCVGCGKPLYRSNAKFESGCGWPSFFEPFDQNSVTEHEDRTLFVRRTEIRCADRGGHLGHVFNDGPPPTGLRYCLNGLALRFEEAE